MKFLNLVSLFAVVTGLFSSACAPTKNSDCQGPADCVEAQAAMCPACPPSYAQICASGACLAADATRISVRANIALHFSLTGDVASVIFAFIDPRSAAADKSLTCADTDSGTQQISASHNVIAAGFVNFQSTSGTALFPDANFGQVPKGTSMLVVRGFSQGRGEGELVAAACVDELQITGPDPLTLTVSLAPVE